MKYIEFMRDINKIVNIDFDELGVSGDIGSILNYVRVIAQEKGVELNSDLEVIQLIEIAKNYKLNHI